MSVKTITVRGVTLGEGIPKICVPLVGETRQELQNQIHALQDVPADIVEWRCDWYSEIDNREDFLKTLQLVREELDHRPLLLTFRTAAEGGQREIAPENYQSLLADAVQTGFVDLVDVELFMGDDRVRQIVEFAHKNGAFVIASNHDFKKTPEEAELTGRLARMEELGADIAKIAVMPQAPRDVLTLLAATCSRRECAQIPLITMSMGDDGVISRLAGETFGSAMTFGAVGKASAPGQVPAEALAEVLKLLHH